MDDYLYDADTYLQSDAGIVKGKQGDSFQILKIRFGKDIHHGVKVDNQNGQN
jgi:hypothetical protein